MGTWGTGLYSGDLAMDLVSRTASRGGKALELGPKEFGALELLPADGNKSKLNGTLGARASAIVRKEGVIADTSNILQFARDHLASYKIPRTIEFVAQLPRNAGGKVLRRELRETYRQ